MRSCAIVGFSPKSFYLVKNSKADEIWTLNYAFLVHEDFPRIDRLFEIHKRDWYLRKEQVRNVEYDEWLQRKHNIPIYMQESELTPLVPDGVAYPKKEICERLLKNLVRMDFDEAKGEYDKYFQDEVVTFDKYGKHVEYFTSSFAYMIAFAIYEGFDVIEVYGIDMEINTEYGYQKPCGEFWIGIALGLGIKVILPKQSALCDAVLYGYDYIPYVDPIKVNEVIVYMQGKLQAIEPEMLKWRALLAKDLDNEDLKDKWLETSAWYYMYTGAINAAAALMKESDTYISRQFVEIKRGQYINGTDYWKGEYNHKRGLFNQGAATGYRDLKLAAEAENARASMYANDGALQLHLKLIRLMDLRPVTYDLKLDIREYQNRDDMEKDLENVRYMGDNLEGV